jgi:hypothetical protein
MIVAAGQMARPPIALNFTTAARENQHLPGAGSGGVRLAMPPRSVPPTDLS